ncbi:NAD(P)-dependent oxidoreductase [Helicobacter sp. 11S03491-1]|uniref:NAD-dependent epimerase/dehydratase family protein n=1 Tax=Helicobacter sp. 11S03491-1 TaxID=1476196 RepID=UPI000BA66710|nr:NAD(P)-dependent oxidoreductase [Helicobacter sp. 11S03491-1]PAF43460.1 hypothetical protein BKH45_02200 [Helicobacter sp. 11S03491-1]
MRCIVVGGSGFLGEYAVDLLLENGYEVVILDISMPKKSTKAEFFQIDLTKDFDFDFFDDDVVIHLAARQYHQKPPRKDRKKYFFDLNYFGTKKLLEVMETHHCKNLIYFSTDMVYGKPLYLPLDPNHPKNPFGQYGRSKLESEKLCDVYRNKGFCITIFRPRMIVGRGRFGILTKLFKLMDLGLPIPLIGDGKNCYQMVSVKDCASAILLAIKHQIPNVALNLGSQNPPQVKTLLQESIHKVGSKSKVIPTCARLVKYCIQLLGLLGIEILYKEQYEIADKQYILDITQTKNILGWEPLYQDKDMLIEAYEEYKQNYHQK